MLEKYTGRVPRPPLATFAPPNFSPYTCPPLLPVCVCCHVQEEQQWGALLQQVQQLDQHQLTAAAATPTQQPAGDGGPDPTAATSAAAGVIDAAAGSEGPDAAAAAAAAGAGAGVQAEAELEGGEELAALERLHAGLHCHLAMQVEGVCKLVGDVEEMVGRANRSAQAVQVRSCH